MGPTLAMIVPLGGGSNLPPFGGGMPAPPQAPSHPIQLPPLPPGVEAPSHPIALPPDGSAPSHPITIPGTPEHPIAAPPGTIWPPLDPSNGVAGKALVLIFVYGAGQHATRWLVVDVPTSPEQPWVPPAGGTKPPAAQPK
jgi:hypothetical protein